MHTPNPKWTAAATGRSAVYPRPRQSAWRQVLDSMRAPVWPTLLATLCAAGLLMVFQEVVHAGVLQGEARNRAAAAHSNAVWRCDFMRDVSQRASCHAQLSAERQVNAALNNPRGAPPEAVALARR